MNFKTFSDLVASQFTQMCNNSDLLFKSTLSGNDLWEIYLKSFKPENDPVFRDPNSSTHNCNLDKNFIRRYGNVVALDANLNIITMWDLDLESNNPYYDSVEAMKNSLKSSGLQDVFFETFHELNSLPYEKCNRTQESFRLGIEENHKMYSREEVNTFGVVKEGQVYEFFHFYGDLPRKFVDFSGDSIESIRASFRDAKNVLKRGLDEIPLDTLKLVRDLINQGSLLNGDTHLGKVESFIKKSEEYQKVPTTKQDVWSWLASNGYNTAKFKNELIGVLCTEIAEGMDLNKACKNWNIRVDPKNYMKAVAPITKAQVELAKRFVEENGYEESFDRRFTTIDDIDVSEIVHVSKGEEKKASIFDGVSKATSTRHKRAELDGIQEVTIEEFMNDILPNCTSVQALVENRMKGNLVSLTTSNNTDSRGIFKWNNNFSWTYNGNLSGKSQIQEAVKTAGGNIEGVLRFSIMWADGDGDNSDLDAHCQAPDGIIYYGRKKINNGSLDVDITQPNGKLAVENIVYTDVSQMREGTYTMLVNQFSSRGSKGFKAQVEVNGEIYEYSYNTPVKGKIKVAQITLKNGVFTVEHFLPQSQTSTEVWGLTTKEFAKVNLVCLSPNHWGDNNNGDKHYFFMIDGCHPETSLRSFHNDNLNSDLVEHRKVMDTLALTMMLEPQNIGLSKDKPLSGLGFNATVRDELVVKVEGSFKRMLKIKF